MFGPITADERAYAGNQSPNYTKAFTWEQRLFECMKTHALRGLATRARKVGLIQQNTKKP